jgi:hypothetical protein
MTFVLTATLFACAKKEEKPTEISAQANAESTAETAIVPASVEFSVENFEELQSVISGFETDTEVGSYLYVCSYPTVNRQEEKTKPVYVVPEGITGSQQIHWPIIPVLGTEPFQVAACAEMGKNPKFDGAKIIKDQYLQLGEINGEPCVRVHLDTDKGDFITVMNEACEIIWVWTEGEEKTVQYYFPQSIDINVADNEALMQAFHIYHADEHYKNGIICNAAMAVGDCTDGSALYKVTFVATTGDFSVLLDEFGRVIERTK